MTSLKTLLAAALIAGSAGVAFADDNGDGARTLAEIRATQQTAAGYIAEGRNAATAGEFHNGDAQVFRPQAQSTRQYEGRNSAEWTSKGTALEYRGSAN